MPVGVNEFLRRDSEEEQVLEVAESSQSLTACGSRVMPTPNGHGSGTAS
ncbi:hypothetical protein ACSYGO_07515 [Streptomyces krungchingensis]